MKALCDASALLRTARNTRQGCRFGGMIFNLIYMKTLRVVKSAARGELGLPTFSST